MAKTTPATAMLQKAGCLFQLHAYAYDPAAPRIGLQAAESLDVVPERVFKTLMAEVIMAKGPEVICALLPSNAEMSLKKLAVSAGGKSAVMVKSEVAEKLTGYHVGGISPLGQKKRVRMFADRSLSKHQTVFINGGQRGLQIEIKPETLLAALPLTLTDLIAE